jgi:hypothetical protein
MRAALAESMRATTATRQKPLAQRELLNFDGAPRRARQSNVVVVLQRSNNHETFV